MRKDYFSFKRDEKEENRLLKKLNPNNEPFLFLHDDPERDICSGPLKGQPCVIDRTYIKNKDLKIITNDNSENIFHFAKILENAEEIHSMESSFKSLIEFLDTTTESYYHDFRNQPLGNYRIKDWEIIKYV